MKTVGLSERTHRELQRLKIESGAKSTEEIIERMIAEHKKKRLLGASAAFRTAMKARRLSPKDVAKRSHTIRDDLYEEWFS